MAYLANVKSCSVVSRLGMTARTASREIFSLRVLGCRAIFANAVRVDEATLLIAFLGSDTARGAIERAGMELPR